MGSNPAPFVANLFMARRIADAILKIAQKYGENALTLIKRFLYDLFFIFIGKNTKLHKMLKDMTNIHPNIEFTIKHTTPKEETPSEAC